MNIATLIATVVAFLAEAHAFVGANQVFLTLGVEILAGLALIWAGAYHPFVVGVVLVSAYMLSRYGGKLLGKS